VTEAFAYAQNQFLGLTFEPFELTTGGVRYVWSGRGAWLVRSLLSLGLSDLAFRLFAILIEVD
jgi:hypothetical protein